MDCSRIIFTGHAVKRMFERKISKEDVVEVLKRGELIEEYPDDVPFPSFLLLGWVRGQALHVVAALEKQNQTCYVITVYPPDLHLWDEHFRKRRAR
ncbi:MAG: hypothetical protein A2V67_00665 [Deltaproteobacteria bacterium RBG_13_61_14]|nr:MAG: hypothetical protein A2V67_00665 [Deltaproteobacteria bacterium RBG_13_61_14]